MKTNWILPTIGFLFLAFFIYAWYGQYQDCKTMGGVLVSSVGGWECVEPR